MAPPTPAESIAQVIHAGSPHAWYAHESVPITIKARECERAEQQHQLNKNQQRRDNGIADLAARRRIALRQWHGRFCDNFGHASILIELRTSR
jgi:hypothetical protein